MRRLVSIAALIVLAGCGASEEQEPAPSPTPTARQFEGAQVQAPPPGSSGALVEIADSPQSRERLAYVDETRLSAAELPFSADKVRDRVLGDGFQSSSAAGIVSIGFDATVPEAAPDAGANAIAASAQSAVQACLGDAFAETIYGPATMGKSYALGAGLATSPQDPELVELRICSVPPLIELHDIEKALERRLGKRGVVEEREIRELDLMAGTIPADALDADQVLAVLGSERRLREFTAPHR